MNPSTTQIQFPLAKVRALKAYYRQCSAALKGRTEWNDYDTAAKLCDQIISLMSGEVSAGSKNIAHEVTTA